MNNQDDRSSQVLPLQLHYSETGEGYPLLLLHGNRQNSDFFEYQIHHFKKHFRTIAIDSRGHGHSPFGHTALSIPLLASDILHLMNRLSLSTAFVIGFSDGANIAINLSLMAPERFRGMAVSSPNLHPAGLKISYRIMIRLAYLLVRPFVFIPRLYRYSQLLHLMLEEPDITRKSLACINLPILIMAGEHDIIQESHIRMIADAIPNSKLVVIPGGGHAYLRNKHEESNLILSSFFKNLLER